MTPRKFLFSAIAVAALTAPMAVSQAAPQGPAAETRMAPLVLAKSEGISGKYIVMLESTQRAGEAGMESETRAAVADVRSNGVNVVEEFTGIGGFVAEMTEAQVAELRKDPRVLGIKQDRVVSLPEVKSKSVSDMGTQAVGSWSIDRIDQQGTSLDGRYNPPGNGAGVNAYVIDTGIQASHAEFRGRVGQGYDFMDKDNNPDDCQGHGTHVSGSTSGASVGVAPGSTIFGLRTFGCTGKTEDSIITAAVNWVASNARKPAVVNMSVGGSPDPVGDAAIKRVVEKGITVVVAAGNDTKDACGFSPARESSAITVGATEKSDTFDWYSNFGRCVDISAPGTDVRSAQPGSKYGDNTGTSMASPHVAGAAAVYLGKYPNATPADVERALKGAALSGVIKSPKGSPNLLLNVQRLFNFPPAGGGGNPGPVDPGPVDPGPVDPGPVNPGPGPGNPGGDLSNNTPYPLNDFANVRSTINSNQSGAKSVTVNINVDHSCLQNLGIAITTPDGVRNVVKRAASSYRCEAWRGVKSETYPLNSKSDGQWVLEMSDEFRGNTGTLNGWSLKFN